MLKSRVMQVKTINLQMQKVTQAKEEKRKTKAT